jgi:lipopolysaccharide/colanic/teichoic acid biosynthesis glycosyltransferase
VVVISGLVALILLPGWRLLVRSLPRRLFSRAPRRSLFGSRTLIVGTGVSGQEVLRRLRARVDDGYDVQGFIDTSSAHIGERVAGIEIVGSLENVGKVIGERRITDVIFSTDELPYTSILAVISRSNNRNVNFRLVPTSLEAIIGKTRIDDLETLPLVEIEYNIHKPSHRLTKRLFDVAGGVLLLLTVYPVLVLLRMLGAVRAPGRGARALLAVPRILSGQMSFVGLPEDPALDTGTSGGTRPLERVGPYLGPPGITGLAQINAREGLSREEIERYQLYYAKNHSILLDVEILLKATLHALRR